MKNYIICFLIVCLFPACSTDEKPVDFVLNNVTRGSVLRNIERISRDFVFNEPSSKFELLVEQQGDVFDFVRLHITFVDRDVSGVATRSQERVLKDIGSDEFFDGPVDLPRRLISFSFEEAVNSLNLDEATIRPGDQFELRAEVFLEDGRSFSTESTSPNILDDGSFFRSPFIYIINIVDLIDDNRFTGTYTYTVLSENLPQGVFSSGIARVNNGLLINRRNISLSGFSGNFTIANSFLYPDIYGSMQSRCPSVECTIYSGPDEQEFGQFDRDDDTVFIYDVLIGYDDYTGDLGETPPYIFTIRLTKQ